MVSTRYVGAFVLLAGLTYAHLTDTLQLWISGLPDPAAALRRVRLGLTAARVRGA